MRFASSLNWERRLSKKRVVSKKLKKKINPIKKRLEKGIDKKKKAIPLKKETKKKVDKADKIDKKTLSHFKKILLKEREQIVGEVKQTYASSQEMGQDGIQDIGDEAANIYNKQILLNLNENERMRLQEVDEALDRIGGGDYGICDECGEPISLKRLEVRPVAKYCVACLSKMEKGRL
ncbi:MAG: TraR/DksA family transcriptional regulator [Deltaproteobacteria bacterium]|nr:TraR/DksA family transcriptional regulator [Deltaproteobacteria bacterium]